MDAVADYRQSSSDFRPHGAFEVGPVMGVLDYQSMETRCRIYPRFGCALFGNRVDTAIGIRCTRETCSVDRTDQRSLDTKQRCNDAF